MLAAGRTEDAAAAAHKLFAMAAATGQQLHATRLLLLLARAHREAGAPLAALPYALSCAYHARQLAADLLSCEAAVLMAQLWCDLGAEHAQHAQQELEGALPLILAHGSQELQARAQVAMAEALMARHATPASLREDAEWWVAGAAEWSSGVWLSCWVWAVQRGSASASCCCCLLCSPSAATARHLSCHSTPPPSLPGQAAGPAGRGGVAVPGAGGCPRRLPLPLPARPGA